MKTHEIEAWALRAIERVEQHQPNEDSRIELRADWPDHKRAARWIAGHANALRGEPILWVIGVDEDRGVKGASQNNLPNWWAQVKAQFDGSHPELCDLLVNWKGNTVVALYFETERIPFVVKNPAHGSQNGGPVQREVPWRDGTSNRSATHSDLIQLLSPLQRPILDVEVGKGRGFVNDYPLTQPPAASATDHLVRPERENRTMFSTPQAMVAHYLGVKVVNRGRRTARDCKGYLDNVEIWRGNGFCET